LPPKGVPPVKLGLPVCICPHLYTNYNVNFAGAKIISFLSQASTPSPQAWNSADLFMWQLTMGFIGSGCPFCSGFRRGGVGGGPVGYA
jgi:hypothetical protein